ncbi:MAG: hypothetical protein IT429_17075 [Gemmataceae bacterium]|nr:hypothetical protein [Gemmataceae bacterium]
MAFLTVSAATAADHELVAAPGAGRRIRVAHYHLVAAGAVAIQWKSGSTALSGAMTCAAGVPHDAGLSPSEGHRPAVLECAAGEALNLALGGAVQVSGHIVYEIVN